MTQLMKCRHCLLVSEQPWIIRVGRMDGDLIGPLYVCPQCRWPFSEEQIKQAQEEEHATHPD